MAEDITQDTFVALWNHRKNVDPAKVKSWLFTTVNNKMINFLKRESRMDYKDEMQDDASYFHPSQNDELKEILNKGMEKLRPQQRALIVLRDIEGYNYQEIGQILDLTADQVKAHLFQARKKLKEELTILKERELW